MEKIHENMCFDVVFLYENIRTCLFTYVFLYFSAHFYPPLHHNGKGSIVSTLQSPFVPQTEHKQYLLQKSEK